MRNLFKYKSGHILQEARELFAKIGLKMREELISRPSHKERSEDPE